MIGIMAETDPNTAKHAAKATVASTNCNVFPARSDFGPSMTHIDSFMTYSSGATRDNASSLQDTDP